MAKNSEKKNSKNRLNELLGIELDDAEIEDINDIDYSDIIDEHNYLDSYITPSTDKYHKQQIHSNFKPINTGGLMGLYTNTDKDNENNQQNYKEINLKQSKAFLDAEQYGSNKGIINKEFKQSKPTSEPINSSTSKKNNTNQQLDSQRYKPKGYFGSGKSSLFGNKYDDSDLAGYDDKNRSGILNNVIVHVILIPLLVLFIIFVVWHWVTSFFSYMTIWKILGLIFGLFSSIHIINVKRNNENIVNGFIDYIRKIENWNGTTRVAVIVIIWCLIFNIRF